MVAIQENNFNGTRRTFVAEAAVTNKYPVKLGTADNSVTPVTAATDLVIGVANDTVSAGANASVLLNGPTKLMVSAAAIAKGDWVGLSGTAGKIGPLTLAGAGTTIQQVIGVALNAASGADEDVEVMQMPYVYQV